MRPRPVVAILAGGESRRMGRDKATIELDGVSVIERIARAAASAGLRCIVVGRARPHIRASTPSHEASTRDVREPDELIEDWIEDDSPGEGPLAALATALRRVGGDVILVACDMPLVDPASFEWLSSLVVDDSVAGVVPRNDRTLEPLFARYGPEALPAIEEVLLTGRRSIGALIDRGGIAIVDLPEKLRERLANVNTPEDLIRVRRVLEARSKD
ncbi:MAG TPA: molybdenum cofactor guanylyltransferase [Candidatus Kapabacteria bacterium]|nr:molybdenum cofactor guanylyltransferase [Candidatus Kapabacteria bacterium]